MTRHFGEALLSEPAVPVSRLRKNWRFARMRGTTYRTVHPSRLIRADIVGI
jgi:hypothetical protein